MFIGYCWFEQIDAVQDLLRANGWRDEVIPSHGLISRSHAYTALDDGEVIGFIRVVTDYTLVTYVCELVVAGKFRNHGVGKALVDHVQEQFRTARVDVLSTQAAQGFYEAAGFSSRPGYRRYDA